MATTASMTSLRSGRVAQYHVRRWGGSPTATDAMSCVARYGAAIHDGITVTASPVATSSISMSAPMGDRGEACRAGADRDRQRHDWNLRLVVAVAEHEVHVGEVGGGDARPVSPRVARAHDGAQLVVEQALQPHAVDVAVEFGDESDVETVVEEGSDRVVGGQRLDPQLGAGEPLMQQRTTSAIHW